MSEINVVNKQTSKQKTNKQKHLGDVLAHFGGCVASNAKRHKSTAVALKRIKGPFPFPVTQIQFSSECAEKDSFSCQWLNGGGKKERARPVPPKQYKYEITGGHSRLGGESTVSVKQLQVSDWHFALLVSSLTNQPVWIHTWHAADCDHLGDIYSVYCITLWCVFFRSASLHHLQSVLYGFICPANDWV